jgi:chemotaxis signal transduction protein
VSSGYVVFRFGAHTFATSLDGVREIVRLCDVDPLPAMTPPMVGVILLRGTPLPVWDLRPQMHAGGGTAGDCLVVRMDGETVGIAVDRVVSVLRPEELTDGDEPGRTLPSYVTAVHRRDGAPVLMVDLPRLVAAA